MGNHKLIFGHPPFKGSDESPGHGLVAFAEINGYPQWVVRAEIVTTDSGPSIRRLEIGPHPTADQTWDEVETPLGGIPARLVRSVNVGELLDLIAEEVTQKVQSMAASFSDGLDDPEDVRTMFLSGYVDRMGPLAAPRKQNGSAGNGIDHYLAWAVRYVQAIEAGERRPVKVLAAEHKLTETYVRDTITDARRRHGLLTKPGQGRAGGRLTDKALTLIAERETEER